MQAVANQPVVAIIHASPEFKRHRGDEFDGVCSSSFEQGNHAVLIVGYNATHCE